MVRIGRIDRGLRVCAVALLLCGSGCVGGWTAWAQEMAPAGGERTGGFPGGGQMVRGTVTASSVDNLTLKTEAGEVYKVTVTPNTRVMKARQPVKLTEIKAGDGVGAMGVLDAPTKTLHAMFVSVVDAEQIKKAQADLGKKYIVGQVTAIDELKLTIKRPDGVVQVIAVDEGTSFKRGGRGMGMMMGGAGEGTGAPGRGEGQREGRAGERGGGGGESITLADIKVGDAVAGRGALKDGVFVPTELGVSDPGARRRRGAGSGTGASEGAAPAAGGATQPLSGPR